MRPRLDVPALARGLVGVVVGGVVAAVVFLIMVEGSFRKGITSFDFAHILGTAIQGTAKESSTTGQALGVIGDTAGPTALYATLVSGIVLLLVHALVVVRLVRGPWWVRGLVLGAVATLAIGVIYIPYTDARLDTPIGVFGVSEGHWSPVVLILSAFGASMVGARCYDLAQRTGWWEDHGLTIDETLHEITGVGEGSLELAEEGREQGRVHP